MMEYESAMASKNAVKRTYRIAFSNHGQVYEIYARKVTQAELYGFVQVEDIVFGQRSSLVVDPSEERLKNEFGGVKRFFIPIYSVIRIDEVEKEGSGRIRQKADGDGNVALFPTPFAKPGGSPDKKS